VAKNRRFERVDSFTLPVLAGVVSGSPVVVGMLPGVAQTDRDASGNASVRLTGGFDVTVTAAGSVAIGAPVYITSATYALTDAAGVGKQLFGHALQAKSSGASVITVRLADFAVANGAAA
jgi:predicted RecA/RadA family phage recombinase